MAKVALINGFDPEIRIGANGPLLKKKENQ
jgi:hypothetical protein